MPREKQNISVNPDQIDSFKAKLIRHVFGIVHGIIDPQAIIRGAKLIWNEGLTYAIASSSVKTSETIKNAFGIKDLSLTTFHIEMPVIPNVEFAKRNDKVQFVNFPSTCSIYVDLRDGQRIPTHGIFRESDTIVAAFTGPTSLTESDYPNNGFYYKERLYKSFEDAESRKGAFALLSDGSLITVDDKTKKLIIKNQFQGTEALVGTSFYFSNEDTLENFDINKYNGRSRLSYLLMCTSNDGSVRIVYVLATMGTRRKMKEWIDKYCDSLAIKSYMAVELERDQADCFIKQNDHVVSLLGDGFNKKPDHYIVRLK